MSKSDKLKVLSYINTVYLYRYNFLVNIVIMATVINSARITVSYVCCLWNSRLVPGFIVGSTGLMCQFLYTLACFRLTFLVCRESHGFLVRKYYLNVQEQLQLPYQPQFRCLQLLPQALHTE